MARFLGEASFLPATLRGNRATTLLGDLNAQPGDLPDGPVEVVIRPADCLLMECANELANGKVVKTRYEGATRFYGVELDDGTLLAAPTDRGQHIQMGQRVRMEISSERTVAVLPSVEQQ